MRALSRISHWLCGLLPCLALAVGAAGYLLSLKGQRPEAPADVALADTDLMQIDQVLERRVPELGLPLRRRVAEAILEESKRAHYDPLLILGLIETESSFIGEAVSVAGARGLMQILPSALEYLASLEGVRLSSEEIYRDPAMQVRFAIRYLVRLEKRFHSLDLALMAYNGGPERLRQALEENDADAWFGNYVRTVRMNQARFHRRLAPASLAQADRAPASPGSNDVAHMP